jgi:hypothetical protein
VANQFTIVINAVDKATSTVRKIKGSIADSMAPVTDLGNSLSNLGRETGLNKVASGFGVAAKQAGSLARQVALVATPLAALGSVLSIAGLASLVTGWGRAGQELGRTSTIVGVGTGTLQEYRGVARLAGISTGEMDSALQSLGDTMQGSMNGRAPQALALMNAYGMSLRKTKDAAIDTTASLMDVSKIIQKNLSHGGTIQSARLIASAFGVESLLSLLVKGPEVIRRYVAEMDSLNATMSPAQIAQGEEYARNVTKLGLAVDSLKNSIGNALIPVLEPAIKMMTEWLAIPENKAKLIDGVSAAVKFLSDAVKNFDWDKAKEGAGEFFDVLEKTYKLLTKVEHGSNRIMNGAEMFGNSLRGHGFQTNAQVAAGPEGSANTQHAIDFFQARGWSKAQAIGLTANLVRESGVDETAVGDNGKAMGIAQWHPDRQANFQKHAGNWIGNSTLDQQLGFVDYELRRGTEQGAGAALQAASTPEQAAAVASRLYERPAAADAEANARAAAATRIAGLYDGNPAPKIADTLAPGEKDVTGQTDAGSPGNAGTAGAPGATAQGGTVKVDINLTNAPRGTTTNVQSSGNVNANARIGHSRSMDLGAAS